MSSLSRSASPQPARPPAIRSASYPSASPVAPTGLRKKFIDSAIAAPRRDGIPRIPRRKLEVPSTIDSNVNAAVTLPGPDIQWNPSFKTYQERVMKLAAERAEQGREDLGGLPTGFPEKVDAKWCWTGEDFCGDEYVVQLDEKDVDAIENGLEDFKRNHGDVPDLVTKFTFPLPNHLANKLHDVAVNIHSGYGFNIIRGLEPRRYSPLDNTLIYLGITSYIAEQRGVQDSGGSMIIHVKDLGLVIPDSELRQSPYARNSQPFHNDVCDILAMYVQEAAAQGGESHLASAAKVYNEIAATRPDVIRTLAKDDWVFDKHQTPAYWNTRALLFNFADKGPGFCFSRRPITGSPTSPRSPDVPHLTETQAEAIDMVHFVGVKHQLTMRLERGDIQLVNNLAIQHARNGFRDSAESRRHVLRLWLRNDELAWETPDGLKRTWTEKYGGPDVSERRRIAKWNFEPGASRERVLYRSDSCS